MAEEATTGNGGSTKKKMAKKKAAGKASTKKRGTTKRAASEGGHGSKVAFINKHAGLKPLEVEAKAKEAGLSIKAGYVSSVRSKAKASGRTATNGKSARANSSRAGAEADFRRAARGITLDRAQEILDEIKAAYEG